MKHIYIYIAVAMFLAAICLLITSVIILKNANPVESKYTQKSTCELASRLDKKCLYWDKFNKKCINGKSDSHNRCKANQPVLSAIIFFLAMIFLSISIFIFIQHFVLNQKN
jgi:hypothetical protein